LPLAVGVEHRDRHDRDARIGDARDALDRHVVGLRGDDPGEPRPVARGIGHSVGAVEDRLARRHLAGEVRMQSVDAGVEERYARRPGRRHVSENLVPGYPRQCPLVSVERIRRDRLPHTRPVLLHAHDPGIGLIVCTDRVEFTR
jgi:hypothetical protein